MAAAAKRIEIGVEDRAALEAIVAAGTSQARMVARARIMLCAGEGRSAAQIGRRVGCSANTAQKWRGRFERQGLDGLAFPRPVKDGDSPGPIEPTLSAANCAKSAGLGNGRRTGRLISRRRAAGFRLRRESGGRRERAAS